MTLSFEMVYIIWPNVILLLSPRRLCIVRRLSVCPCVCLLAILRKTADQVFMKILPQTYLWTKKNLLTSGSHPPPDSDPGKFYKDSSTYYSLAHISGKLIGYSRHSTVDATLDREVTVIFWKSSAWMRSPDSRYRL